MTDLGAPAPAVTTPGNHSAPEASPGDRHRPPIGNSHGRSPSAGDGAPPARPPDDDSVRARFSGVPVDTYMALQEWNDAVVRECELIAALDSPPHLPARLLELAVRLSGHFASTRESYRDVVDHARAEGAPVVELEQRWPQPVDAAVAAADAFLVMMEELDDFCLTDVLLAEPAAPDVVRLRRWFVTELRSQLIDHQASTPFDRAAAPTPLGLPALGLPAAPTPLGLPADERPV